MRALNESTIPQRPQVHRLVCTSRQTEHSPIVTHPTLLFSVLSVGGMLEYRLYVFEAGRLLWPREFRAADDESAIAIAEQGRIEGRQMELWERSRKVRSWGFAG